MAEQSQSNPMTSSLKRKKGKTTKKISNKKQLIEDNILTDDDLGHIIQELEKQEIDLDDIVKNVTQELEKEPQQCWNNELSDESLCKAASKFHLGDNIYLEVTEWRGQRRIDIRQYDENNCRTQKGISLNLSRYKVLTMCLEELTNTLIKILKQEPAEYEIHLGANVYAYAKAPFQTVQIRPKYMRNGDMYYSKYKGNSLKTTPWNQLLKIVDIVAANFSDVIQAQPCYMQLDHCNQIGAMYCKECNPNTYKQYIEDY